MPNKSVAQWESAKLWSVAHPGQTIAIVTADGHFALTWTPKPKELKGQAAAPSPEAPQEP